MTQSFEFEAWFDREFPMEGDAMRPKYRSMSVMDLIRAAWEGSRQQALEEGGEARESLSNMLASIERDGNYSSETTCNFLRQALQCLPILRDGSE